MVTLEEVKNALKSMPDDVLLTPYGNEWGRGSLVRPSSCSKQDLESNAKQFNLQRITSAVQQIPLLFKDARTLSKSTSYGWKHYLEHASDEYISNGDFIIAMLLSGFKCCFKKSVNPVFYAGLIPREKTQCGYPVPLHRTVQSTSESSTG